MSVCVCAFSFFLCSTRKIERFYYIFFLFSFALFFTFLRTKQKKKRGKETFGGEGTRAKSNASQIAQYVVVKGRRGRESAHGVSSETLPGLRVLVRGARGRNYRFVWCGHQRRAKLLFRGEKCKGKEEDVKET